MTGKPLQDDIHCSFTMVEVLSGSRPPAQTDWVHLKGILAQKERRGKCWKKERDHNLFSTCRCMHAISNSRCESNVLFASNVYGESRGWYGEAFFWLAAAAAAGLRQLHRPRGSADAAQEKRNVFNNPWANWDQLLSGNVVSGAGQGWAMISQ